MKTRNASSTERAFTPGPWKWLPKDGQFIVDANSKIVAEIPCQGANEKDGPLIAAAPELLDALKGLSDMYSHAWDIVDGGLFMNSTSVTRFEQAHSKAMRALKKATNGRI